MAIVRIDPKERRGVKKTVMDELRGVGINCKHLRVQRNHALNAFIVDFPVGVRYIRFADSFLLAGRHLGELTHNLPQETAIRELINLGTMVGGSTINIFNSLLGEVKKECDCPTVQPNTLEPALAPVRIDG